MATEYEKQVDDFMRLLDDHIRETVLSMTKESYDYTFTTRENVRNALLALLVPEVDTQE